MNSKCSILSITSLLICVLFVQDMWAQQTDSLTMEDVSINKIDIRLPVNMSQERLNLPEQRKDKPEVRLDYDLDKKEYLSQLADIYRIHVLTLEAEINNDALSAEKYLNEGVSELQAMLERQPEIQSSRRFMELYRTIMAEYQAFYGITDPLMREEGEIFSIQEEMFSDLNDEVSLEDLAFPETEKSETDVPIFQNRQVNNHLAYLWIKRPEIMEAWLQRSEKYFPMIERILKEVGVPNEIKYLAMIESGLNPSARSSASAVGMWQFIQATGRAYGLEVDWWVDERRDPEKATRAAARHLKDLYNIWGDWHLAMANYNISPRGLKRAIRRAGGKKDYWAAYPYLPRETRGYIPSFIATYIIANNPTQFGFEEKYENEVYQYEVAKVTGSYDLKELAKCAGISLEELKDLNPELLRWATPPGETAYALKIPVGTKSTFEKNFKELPESSQRQLFVHTVQSGEWLGKIANKYGISVRELYLANDGLSSGIYPGHKIAIPVPEANEVKVASTRSSRSSNRYVSRSSSSAAPANSAKIYYRVRSGDTIGHIAEWYNTYAWKIRSWNSTTNLIRPGDRLVIYVPESKKEQYEAVNEMTFSQKQRFARSGGVASTDRSSTQNINGYEVYEVRPNDSLYEIAKSFDVTISQLRQLNDIRGSRIYPGQTIKIRKK